MPIVPPFDPDTMNAHQLADTAPQKPDQVPAPALPDTPGPGATQDEIEEYTIATALFDAQPFGGNVVVRCLHPHPRWMPQYIHPENPVAPLVLKEGGYWHMPVEEAIGTDMPSFGRAHPDHPGRDFEVIPDKRTVIKTQADLDRAVQNVRDGKMPLDGFTIDTPKESASPTVTQSES